MSEEHPPRTRPLAHWSDPHTDITGQRDPGADQQPETEPKTGEDPER